MNERARARRLALARTGIGVAFLLAPRRAMRVWLGADTVVLEPAARSIGARDLVIGLGALAALGRGGPAGSWLAAGAWADAADAVATAAARRGLPRLRRLAWTVAAAGAAVGGLRLARRVG
jgi:hypothetical protein